MAGCASVMSGAAQSGPGLLERIQAFAERYQRDAPSLVAEERYLQNVPYTRGTPQHREMTSELVMVRLPGSEGWVILRDVHGESICSPKDAPGRNSHRGRSCAPN
ncbi:MAG TPA: hypothetical protein VF491_07960 [Vicinamibacterales bacterium]